MKKLLLALLLAFVAISPVFAYTNGDKIEEITATVPSDGTTIRFTLPQGEYPSGSKVTLYAQTNVLCMSPGVDYVEPTPDKNPYKLLAEYKFTDNDIASLKNGETEFTTTLKFDPECGAIIGKIVGGDEKVNSSLAEDNRPQGSTESSDGKQLTVYGSGMKLNSKYSVSNGVLTFTVPQGSYTLGDFVVISKGDVAVTSLSITKDIMDKLVDGAYTSKVLVEEVTAEDELTFFISSVMYEKGEDVNGDDLVEVEPNPETNPPVVNDPSDEKESNPLLVGVGVFVLVLAVGFGYMYLEEQKKKSKKSGK